MFGVLDFEPVYNFQIVEYYSREGRGRNRVSVTEGRGDEVWKSPLRDLL